MSRLSCGRRVGRGAAFFLVSILAFSPLFATRSNAVNVRVSDVERRSDRYRVVVEAPPSLPNYLVERTDKKIWVRVVGGISTGSQILEGDSVIRSLKVVQRKHSMDLILESGPDAAGNEVYFEDEKKRLVIDIRVVSPLVRADSDRASPIGTTPTPTPTSANPEKTTKVQPGSKPSPRKKALAESSMPTPLEDASTSDKAATALAAGRAGEATIKARPEPVLRVNREPRVTKKKERRLIVIDAGHGGIDSGAIGTRGTMEKDVNLAVAKALAKHFSKLKDYDVVMTRTTDTFIPLGDRTQVANKANADLFVSIHCNSSLSAKNTGFETYVLAAEASDQAAAAVARVENSVVSLEGKKDGGHSRLGELLASMAVNEFINESTKLASVLCHHVRDEFNTDKAAVKEANFFVLRGAQMPAVLVELEYLSNPISELRLRSSRYQTQMVKGIAEGIRAYMKELRHEREAVAAQYREALTKIEQ